MRTLIIAPTDREARALGPRANVFVCGTGEAAYVAVSEQLAVEKVDLVVVAGFCGGLDPSLKPGAAIVGRHVIAPGKEAIDVDRFLVDDIRKSLREAGLDFIYSRLLTLDRPAATKDEKRDLWNEFGAGGVDMETYQVAAAARAAHVRWLAVRVVIDPASVSLPRALAGWENQEAEKNLLLRSLAHPADWPRYAKLGFDMPKAQRSLRRTTAAVIRAANAARTVETLPLMEATQ